MQQNFLRLGMLFVLCLTLNACASKTESYTAACPPPSYNLLSSDTSKLGIRIVRVGDNVRIILPADNIFMMNSAEIGEAAYPGLNEVATYLNNYSNIRMTVVGYTDNLNISPHNQWLADQQAKAIAAFMWTRGLSHELLQPIAAGNIDPIASNRSVQGSILNRRVEIIFRAR